MAKEERIDVKSIVNNAKVMKGAQVFVKDLDTQKVYTVTGIRVPDIEKEFESSTEGQAKIKWFSCKRKGFTYLEMMSPTELERLRSFFDISEKKKEELFLCAIASAIEERGLITEKVIAFARLPLSEETELDIKNKVPVKPASGATVFDVQPIKKVT